jgi:hypothetical protein
MSPTPGFARKGVILALAISFYLPTQAGTQTQVRPRIMEAVDNARRIPLTGNVHPLARAEFDRGAVFDGLRMTRMLLLLQRSNEQEAALQDYLEKQQDKSSPNFHQWLAPEEFGALYGPADADIQAVTQWLGSQGFTVERVYSGKTVMEFSGTAGQVRAAFGAEIRNYQIADKSYVANASDPQIPIALAPVVAGIVSLNNFPRQSHARVVGQALKIAGKPGMEPLFTFPRPSGNGNFYGVGPGDFATIYNSKGLISAGTDGTGQTIAIVGETNINVSDMQAFRQMFGLAANFDATNVILNGEDPGITSTGEEIEADLDVQWSGAVAPGATVKYVVSASTPASQGIDLSALYIIEHNLAGVMSESYGNCETALGSAGNAFFNALWEQAAAQGITVMVSSGDGGSAGCDNFDTETQATLGLAVSGLASTPYNVAVGGTDFDQVNKWGTYWSVTNDSTTGASALSYIPEIPWNENCAQIGLSGCGATAPNGSLNIVAGSGGPSRNYAKPKWQLGVTGMPNDNHRHLPDVSLFASPGFDGSGYVVCAGTGVTGVPAQCNLTPGVYNFSIVGGTSVSAPAFAGIMALVNQYEASHGGTNRQGNANNVLYALVKKTGASCTSSAAESAGCIFNDITKGNSVLPTGTAGVGTNSVPCKGGTANCSATVAAQTGVLVEPSSSTTEAWTAGAGYDMATGLGSVNVNNLATNWATVSTVATKTSLTLLPTTGITHGTNESVTVNITVKANSGTATGDVSLIANFADGTTQGLDQFTLTNGQVANGTTNSLPGGTSYTVTAHYAGDGTNAPSDSAPVTVTVGKENSQAFIVIPTFDSSGNLTNGNATSVQYGSNYIIRMYVTDKNAVASTTGPPSPACYQENFLTCPTGTITLTANGTGVDGANGIYALNNAGYTRDINPTLSGGTYSLLAQYSGDNSYLPSSRSTSFVVVPSITALSAPFDDSPQVVVGVQTLLGSTLTSGAVYGAAPTGTVTFYDGTNPLPGTVSFQTTAGSPSSSPASGSATLFLAFTAGGTRTITAKYSGDANYAAATSNPLLLKVLYPTMIRQSESPNTVTYGQSVTVTATVTSSQKTPPLSGTFFFYPSSTAITGPVTTTSGTDASGNQFLTATVTTTPQSGETIQVQYGGDPNFANVNGPIDWITVNIPDFTMEPANGVSVVPVAGQPGSGQITITPLSQTPSTVALSFSPLVISGYTIALSPQQVSLNGSSATATISLTPTGSAPASAIRSQARHAGFFAMKRGDWWLLSLVTGLGVPFLLGLPGRRKRFRAALGLSVVCLLFFALGCGGGSGGTGGGDGGGGGGGGGTPQPQPTSIALTTSNAKVAQNAQFIITATVTSSKPLTGTVNFYNYGSPVNGGIPPTNGQAQTGSGYINNPGLYQITATYSGDASNSPSTSAPLTQVITGTMPVTIQGNTGGDFHYLQAMLGVQ